MHELSIAESVLDIIKKQVKDRVTAVRLRIGELSGVVPEALEFSFQSASIGTIAEGAALVIERVPVTARCGDCAEVFNVEDYCFACAKCGGGNFKLITGRELQIEEIEVADT